MATIPDPTLAGYIARLKAAVGLAEAWTKGDETLDVVGSAGTYASLAKLIKTVKGMIEVMLVNPIMTGVAGFTPPKGTTAQREAGAVKGRIRYNTSLDAIESLTASGWLLLENVIIASYVGNVTPSSGTTKTPYDATPPLITEGTLLWSKQVTPQAVGAVMSIEFGTTVDSSSSSGIVTMAIYRDAILIGVASTSTTGLGNAPSSLRLVINDPVVSLVPVTYSCRLGGSTGTWYQGRGASATLGGTTNNGWKISEVLP